MNAWFTPRVPVRPTDRNGSTAMPPTLLNLNITLANGEPSATAVFNDLSRQAARLAGRVAHVSVTAHESPEPADGPTDDDLGRIAYDTYTGSVLAAGLADPEGADDFDDLHPDQRHAW